MHFIAFQKHFVALGASQCTGDQNILDFATAEEGLSTLVDAAQAAGFQNGLERDGPIALIAPTNEAFVITLGSMGITAEELMAHPEVCDSTMMCHGFCLYPCVCMYLQVLKPILSYHVLLDGISCEESPEGDIETALEGNFVSINGSVITDGFGDTAKIIKTIWTSNGPIYIVDRVIFPKIPDSTEETQTTPAPSVPEPEAPPGATVPNNVTVPITSNANQNEPTRDQRLQGLWNDLLQWSDSFSPANIFGRFFPLQI